MVQTSPVAHGAARKTVLWETVPLHRSAWPRPPGLGESWCGREVQDGLDHEHECLRMVARLGAHPVSHIHGLHAVRLYPAVDDTNKPACVRLGQDPDARSRGD
jgi:hypothetical protein